MKYTRLFFFFALVLFLLPQQSCSQTYATKKSAEGKAKRIFDRGKEYRKNNHTDKAIKDFNSVIAMQPDFIDAYLQLAGIQVNQKNWAAAKVNLQKAVELDPTYDKKALFYLGLANWETDNFEEAAQHFEQFASTYTSQRNDLQQQAKQYARNSAFAATAIKNPVPFQPVALPPSINTNAPEYLPSITAEGNTLIFTRRAGRQEDVFSSDYKNGAWQTATPIENINTEENEGSSYIAANGQLIVFNRCSDRSGYGGCDLYFSEKKNGTWTQPENMGQPINTKGWEAQPSLSADGQLLYFSSNREGGKGGRDIWLTYRRASGRWAKPINLGTNVNTTSDDESPFYHPDGNTLYFMSTGHPGMGGYDLFLSRRTADGNWGAAENLGYPINTKGNEGALFVTLDGRTAFFTNDGLKLDEAAKDLRNSNKQPDLFTFDLPPAARANPVTYLKATVKDASTQKRLPEATIELIELASGTIMSTSTTDAKGNFLTCIPLGKDYALNVNKTHYLFHSENFALSETATKEEPYLLKINLQAIPEKEDVVTIEKPKPIILKNVFFESGAATLKSTSLVELDRLHNLLVENPNLNIQINGHTDNVGSDSDNLRLSTNRAKAVQDYLIEKGIASNRLKYKGFGENQPIVSNDTKVGKRNNRRTEFVLF